MPVPRNILAAFKSSGLADDSGELNGEGLIAVLKSLDPHCWTEERLAALCAYLNLSGEFNYEELLADMCRGLFPDEPKDVVQRARSGAAFRAADLEDLDDSALQGLLEEAETALAALESKAEGQRKCVASLKEAMDIRAAKVAADEAENERKLKARKVSEARTQALGAYASPRFSRALEDRPIVEAPFDPADWSFERVALTGLLLKDAKLTMMSLIHLESGAIGVTALSGEELFQLPALESLTSCEGLQQQLAQALDKPADLVRLFEDGSPMEPRAPVQDINSIGVGIASRTADYPYHCRSLFKFELPLCVDEEGQASGCFIARYKGEPFTLLTHLSWYFRTAYMGFHTAGDTIDIKTKVSTAGGIHSVVAYGNHVVRSYKAMSGPSSISGPWDCVPAGPSSTVLQAPGKHVQETICFLSTA